MAADNQGVTVVGQTIEGSAGQQVIAEDLSPFFEGAVTGDDQRTGLITVGNEVIQILSGRGGQGLQAEIIQNQQVHGQEFGQETAVGATGPGGVQVGQQTLGAPGEDPQLSFQGFDSQGIGEVTFSSAI